MKKIPIGENAKYGYAIVDDDDYESLSKYRWGINGLGTGRHHLYARRCKGYGKSAQSFLMHREILNVTDRNIFVDHINHNCMDNRKENLRVCTHSQNMMNSKIHIDNKSGYKGVYWHKTNKRWVSRINIKKKPIDIGYFDDKMSASKAFGEFANLNFAKG